MSNQEIETLQNIIGKLGRLFTILRRDSSCNSEIYKLSDCLHNLTYFADKNFNQKFLIEDLESFFINNTESPYTPILKELHTLISYKLF